MTGGSGENLAAVVAANQWRKNLASRKEKAITLSQPTFDTPAAHSAIPPEEKAREVAKYLMGRITSAHLALFDGQVPARLAWKEQQIDPKPQSIAATRIKPETFIG